MLSASEAIKQNFPNTKFYYACHQDTDNTHVHVVLLKHSKENKKHDLRKGKLVDIKRQFAKSLNLRGIVAEFFSETDKKKLRGQSKTIEIEKNSNKRKEINGYTILDFDKAPYKFEVGGKPSFYIILETKNKKIKTHWSLGIQTALEESGAKIGDKVTLKQVKNVNINEKNENGKFKRSSWHIEILGKTETKNQNYQVIDFGYAPYKFDKKGKSSFYMIIRDKDGCYKDLWGKTIEKSLLKKGIRVGDKITCDINKKIFIKVKEENIVQVSFKDRGLQGFKM